MCTEAWSRADQCGGGAREIEFPAEGVASKLHLAPACSEALPDAHVCPGVFISAPRASDADLFLCILQSRSPGVVEFS